MDISVSGGLVEGNDRSSTLKQPDDPTAGEANVANEVTYQEHRMRLTNAMLTVFRGWGDSGRSTLYIGNDDRAFVSK